MCLSYGMSKLSYLRSRLAMFKLFSVKLCLTQNVGIKLCYTCGVCYT